MVIKGATCRATGKRWAPACLLLALGLLAAPALAGPDVPAAPAPDRKVVSKSAASELFEDFCNTWMGKLRKRESRNQAEAEPSRNGDGYHVEYTGYSEKPARCETKATGVKSNPFVGKLVYYERRYRKQGGTAAKAKAGRARVVSQTEIMEIFRFDGSNWVY